MITAILDLKTYIINNVGIDCTIGIDEKDTDTYIRIIPDQDFDFYKFNEKVAGTNFPVTIEINTDRENTIKGFEILEKLVRKLNQYDDNNGSSLLESGSPEYTENKFKISLVYNLKTIIQDTEA